MNDLQIVLPKEQFTPTAWEPSNGLTYEEWQEIGQGVAHVGGAVNWWIGDWILYGQRKWGEKYAGALELFEGQYEYNVLARMASVAERVHFSLRKLNLSWSHHLEVAKLEPEAQATLLHLAEQNHLSVRDLREAVREHDRAHWLDEKGADLQAVDMDSLPTGAYRILYADPPWAYGNQMPRGTTTPINYYPAMSTPDIMALPVGRLAQEDAILFLWSTAPHLPEALAVAGAWGFAYKTDFIWDKVLHNMGHYSSVRHEHLLICGRGASVPDVPRLHDSVVEVERGDHSAKPEVFREIIDTLYTHGRRLELFARNGHVAGWDAWGNQSHG